MRSNPSSISLLVLSVVVAGCATAPVPDTQVVTMKADESGAQAGFPAPGTVWRLDEQDLKTLSPAPYVPPPPTPIPMPPREQPRVYASPPPVGVYPYWGRGWPHSGSNWGFSLRYGYPRYRYPYYW